MLNRDLKLIFTTNVVGSFGDGLFAYLLPVYMRNVLEADPIQIGILYALTVLAAAFTLLISGTLADRHDRKKNHDSGMARMVACTPDFRVRQELD